MNYRDLPIRRKVTLAVLLIFTVALVIGSSGVLVVSSMTFRKRAATELRTLAEIVAASVNSSVLFDDSLEAAGVLDRLRRGSGIVEAHVLKLEARGTRLFASSPANAAPPDLTMVTANGGLRMVGDGMWFVRELKDDKANSFAVLAVRSDLRRLRDEQFRSVATLLAVMAAALLVSFMVASAFKRSITEPLSLLAETAHTISNNRDPNLRVRAPKLGADEVGSLADNFNRMLDTLDGQAKTLAEQEERYRLLVENSAELVCEIRLDGTFIYVNSNYERVLGFTPEELQGSSALALVNEEDLPTAAAALQQREAQFALRMRTKDGAWRWLECSGRSFRTGRGEERGVIISRDITGRRQSEEALRQSEERYQLAVRGAGVGLWDWNVLTNEVFYSPRFREMLGYTEEQFPPQFRSFANVLHPEDSERVKEAIDRHFAPPNEPYEIEYRLRTGTGEYRWFQAKGMAILGGDANPHRMAGSIIDVTDRKQNEGKRALLESQLRQAQKMEAIGTLAGGIAHDFNNILGAIIAYTELVKAETAGSGEVVEHLNEVLKASGRARDLVSQILAFSRQQQQERRMMRLQPVLLEVLKMARSTLPATIDIRQTISEKAPTVLADAGQMHQVLLNLFTNAGHAMGQGPGRLMVTLEPCVVDDELARSHTGLRPGRFARLMVGDTGHGMDADTLKRIFDPFFTTKAPGQGTGLGLAVVHGIVHEHGGAIFVYSEAGVGTTFSLYFPAEQGEPEREEIAIKPPPAGTGQRILYVDDEKPLGVAVQRILTRRGFQVEVETNPLSALTRFRAAPEAFDLAVVDLNMPGMTGLDLAGQMLHARPGFPVVLATGFNGDWTEERVRAAGLCGLVMKPYAMDDLIRIIHNALMENQA